MNIVIPMAGSGERFIRAGYAKPKPLIEVDGAPIIKYVVSMFSPEDRYTFICNEEHLQDTELRAVLQKLVPNFEILSVAPHKQGPVATVVQCLDHIDDHEETIVNYCDFYSCWNYGDFLQQTRARKSAGAIAAYRGFHPHMLGTDNYAFIKETNRWMEAIQEKQPFTNNRVAEFASNGTYYFNKGAYVKKYFPELIAKNIKVDGEFYVSMIYNLMVQDHLPVSIYEIQHMLQWGAPTDLEEYQKWSDHFRAVPGERSDKELDPRVDVCLMPMAGRGKIFVDAGYTLPKPQIPVSARPMVEQACASLPPAHRYVFVGLEDQLPGLVTELKQRFENTSFVALGGVTEGQAVTCEEGILCAEPEIALHSSLLIGACDNSITYSKAKYEHLLNDKSIDVAAFSFRNHPSSGHRPEMYGWLKVGTGQAEFPLIESVSVKKPISTNPRTDHAIVGAFYFREAAMFLKSLERLKTQNVRVNGEFYVDSLIGSAVELGYHCVAFEVNDYVCFGTPDDLATFEYWQSFFHKCAWHPYRVESDPSVGKENRALLEKVNSAQVQIYE